MRIMFDFSDFIAQLAGWFLGEIVALLLSFVEVLIAGPASLV